MPRTAASTATVAAALALAVLVAPASAAGSPGASPAHGHKTGTASATATSSTTTAVPPAVPAAPAAAPVDPAYTDPSRGLGASSPSCRYALDAAGRRGCRASGSPLHEYPLSSYGLDVRSGFSLTDPGQTFMSALQTLGAGLWTGLLYLIQGVLLLLEWAFSLDLTREGMPAAHRALAQLQGGVFGDAWLGAAVAVAGVWGIWRGLIQRRTTETLTGLAATVALIVGGLVIIARPAETVGRAAQMTNDGAISALTVATTGRAGDPHTALSSALRGVFASTVHDPWCALQFGSVTYCSTPTHDPARPTVADVWLGFPAQSWQRDRLEKLTNDGKQDTGGGLLDAAGGILGFGDDRKLPDSTARLIAKAPGRVGMQQTGGTFPRLALLALVALGLLGAVCLYAYIALRLLLASAMTLLLLLITPAMLLAPALGDSGRATFIAWFQRLLGAVVSKLIYGVLLAVILVTGRVFTGLQIGWYGTWLVLASFWWGVFLKRQELTGFLTSGLPDHNHGQGGGLAQLYYTFQLARAGTSLATSAARPATVALGAVREDRADARAARTAATSQLAGGQLDTQARQTLGTDQATARGELATRTRLQGELGAVNRRLRGHDEQVAAANATHAAPPATSPEQRALLEHRERLQDLIAQPAAARAAAVVQHADRNHALTGDPVTRTDLDVHHAARRRAHETGLPAEHPTPSPPPASHPTASSTPTQPNASSCSPKAQSTRRARRRSWPPPARPRHHGMCGPPATCSTRTMRQAGNDGDFETRILVLEQGIPTECPDHRSFPRS